MGICLQNTFSQTEKYSSYEGMHFQVSFLQNEFYIVNEGVGVELKIFVATREKTKIDVFYPDGFIENYIIPKDSVLILNISNTYYNTESEIVKKNAIEINTDVPVVVYSFNSQAHTSDSYVSIPVSNWGTKYAVMSVPNDQYTPTGDPPTKLDSIIQFTPRSSEFLLIGGYDNTVVTFRPTSLTMKGKQVGNYYSITLNKGETYLVKSFQVPRGYGDLTSTFISSTNPIGVLSGHVRTAIPQTLPPGKDSKDHLVEMLSPMDSWGNLYCSVPFGTNPNGDLFRVMNLLPNTTLKLYTSSFPVDYSFTDSLEVKTFSNINVPAIWQADKPIQIAQFMARTGIDPESKDFDPSMVLLPPREQFIQRVLFTTPGGVFYNPVQYSGHYAAIVAEEAALKDLYLDGKSVDSISGISSQKILGTNLYWAVLKLQRGTHQLIANKGRFSGVLFGVGEFDSYAMVLGASLLQPNIVDDMAPIIDAKVNCFDITGVTYDFDSQNKTGINFAQVDDKQTFNFNYNVYPPQPNDTIIRFTANVINTNLPGKFVLNSWDKMGNKNTYTYNYTPVEITNTTLLDYGTISWTDSLCLDFVIKNTGNVPAYLDSMQFPTDPRLTYYYSIKTPDTLQPGELVSGRVCFNPKGSIEKLNTDIFAFFGCGIRKRINIVADVVAPAVVVTGWDFGDVYVGDSAKHFVSIENVGNVDLRVDSLYFFDKDIVFEYDSLQLMPIWIKPGEKYEVLVTFKPTRRDSFLASLRFANQLKLNNRITITGRGVAPLFSDYTLDFGKRRIGTVNTLPLNIVNDGNIGSKLFFKNFTIKNLDDVNSQTIQNINNFVDALGILNLNFEFKPADLSLYTLSAILNCDWKLHPDINLTIKGEGSIPNIVTHNYDFGDVIIFSDENANILIVENTGNEELTIDSIKAVGGDTKSFIINYNNLKNLKIPIGGNLQIPVEFSPMVLGSHAIYLGIVNDAMPAYKRRIDTVEIKGNVIPPVDLKSTVQLIGDGDYSTCNRDTVYAVFKNDDDFEVNLTNVDLIFTPNTFDVKALIDYKSLLPIKINPHSDYRIPIQALLYVGQEVQIDVIAMFNGTNERKSSLKISPKTYFVQITNNDELNVLPNDTLSMKLSGHFEKSSQVPVKLDITLFLDEEVLYLITQNPVFEIIQNGNSIKIPLKFEQKLDRIIFTWDSPPIEILENSNWKLDLDFLGLLTTKGSTDVKISISDNNCYLGSINQFKTILKDICMDNLRPIKIIDDEPTLLIYPNPIKNILKIDLNLKKNSYLYISIYDLFGKEFILDKNLFLSKGKYLLIYVVENMTSGKYFLKTVINDKIDYKNINIIR